MGRSGRHRGGSGRTRGSGFGPRERDAPGGRPSRGARGPRSDCANDRARATGLRAIGAHHRSSVPREGVRGDRGGDRFTGAIRPGRFPVVRRVNRARERGHARPPATRGAGDGGRGSADGSPAVRTGDRAGAPQRGRLDGEGRRLATARAVPRCPRGVRSSALPEARPRAGPEMARDVCPARGVRGERVMLAPDPTERFLPSVDRLESAMHAARRGFERGDVDGALGQLGVALKLKPEYDAAWILKGHVLQKAGNLEGALDSFMQSLKCNGDSKEAWMGLASVLHALARLKEEAEAYDRLLAFDPLSIEAWIDQGAVLHELGDYSGAIRCYEEILALRPEHAAAWNNKGAALLRLGQQAEATRCFEEALHLDPDCVDAMANRVYLYETKAYHGEAVLWADRALRIREAPGLWYAKGLAHLGFLESTFAIP